MTYLRNAWYVAGFADELAAPQALLARTLLDEPLVFFRNPAGEICALTDRCPHRFAPLSAGKLQADGSLACAYHGLRFDSSGACTHNPHGDGSLPKAARVQAHAVQERHGLIWWWAGAAEKADPALIPDYSFATRAHPDATLRGYMPTQCDYQLLVDNILDLTHIDFLHGGTLGSGALSRTQPSVTEHDERSLTIAWLSSGDLAAPAFDMHLAQQGQPTDQWTEVTWTAPANLFLNVGATLQGQPRESGADTFNLHLATPQSAGQCHYWYWCVRNMAIDPQSNEFIRGQLAHAFGDEDKPMLEAQQRRIGSADFWSLRPVLLPGDVAAVRARRKLAALIESEAV